ncbi:MAG: phosphatidate cytidylyltransferase [Candidatus Rokubacteria bacterium]|nr:phosphatidate cytidylyltransferase [Candidatus Rokubacteria bacterium]
MPHARDVPVPGSVDATAPVRGAALLKRVLSTVVLLPIFVGIVMLGPVWVFGATVVLVSGVAQWEFTGMFERAGVRTLRWLGLVGGMAVTASFALPVSELVAFTTMLLVVLLAALWRPRGARLAWEPAAVTLFGICYVNWLLGYGFWLRDLPGGADWVLLLVWVTWLGETAAYVVGSTLGRTRLAPVISPRKTVEGAAAQLVVSVLAAAVAQVWFITQIGLGRAVVAGLFLGVVGQLGDLVESALKRSVGTKDTGWLLPGHGGLLDRLDSLLFNTPALFYYARFIAT